MFRNKVLQYQLVFVLSFLSWSLLARGASRQVTLAWDASPDTNVAGYKIHYGTNSGEYPTTLDVGANTFATISGLTPGEDFYFVVTAYSGSMTESTPTNELVFPSPPIVYPSVSIASPAAGAQLNGPASITVNATASDP